MDRKQTRYRIHRERRAGIAASLLAVCALAAAPAHAGFYQQTDLNTDSNANLTALGYPATNNPDNPDLINPWGISHSATSPFWLSDNGPGLATLYNGAGVKQALVVTVAPTPSAPTGQVFNSGPNATDFVVSNGNQSGKATFIFATENGTISGWPGGVTPRPTQSFLAVPNSGSAVYKGLAIATNPNGTFLYAANFNSGMVEKYNSSFQLVSSFADTSPPPVPGGTPPGQNWAPFNVQTLTVGGQDRLFVSYALQDAAKHDDVAGPGNGFVDEFDTAGNFIRRIATDGVLNSPWGLDIAPALFGSFSGDLLVGNFGDGTINVFDPTKTDAFLGTLTDLNGDPIVISGLWALDNGNNGAGFNPNAVYFTAGLPTAGVPDSLESHGLFGDLAFIPEPGSLALLATGLTGLMWFRRRRGGSPGVST